MSRLASRPVRPAPASNSTVPNPHQRPDPDAPPPLPVLFFRPFPTLPEPWRSPQAQDDLLAQYLHNNGTFFGFAKARGLTVDQLHDWLHSEQVVDRLKRLSQLADERAALLARLHRPAAIDRLAECMNNPNSHPHQRRLAASAILRAATTSDRREEKQLRTVPPTSGSSGSRCPSCQTPLLHESRSTAGGTAPASGPADVAPGSDSRPDRILARIGPARSPVPRRSLTRTRPRRGSGSRRSPECSAPVPPCSHRSSPTRRPPRTG